MNDLLEQLGIKVSSLLIQGGNFVILLIVLTFAVYRPLMRVMKERREKIALGIRGAEEAQKRIDEAEKIKDEKIKEADKNVIAIIGEAEQKAKVRGKEIVNVAEKQAEDVIQEAARVAEQKKQEELEHLMTQAQGIIKEAIVKTVEMEPAQIDEKLIHKALQSMKHA